MKTTVDEKKCKLLDDLRASRRSVLEAVAGLPDERWEDAFLGTWSIEDLLAHLIGWDYTNFQAVHEILSGSYPSFFQYYDKDWAAYNRHLVQQYKTGTCGELLAAVESSQRQLLDFLESLPAKDLINGKARSEKGRTITIRTLLAAEAQDEHDHARQVAEFLSIPATAAE